MTFPESSALVEGLLATTLSVLFLCVIVGDVSCETKETWLIPAICTYSVADYIVI